MRLLLFLSLLLSFCSTACREDSKKSNDSKTETISTPPLINYAVVNVLPHDTSLFTEGLLVHDGKLFESTGSPEQHTHTKSAIGIIDLKTGKFDKKIELDRSKYFGEGIVILRDTLYQLTYKNQLGFIYNVKSFKEIGTFKFSNNEGWGFTTNGSELIMSDGTENLTFLKAGNMKPVKTLFVTENETPLKNLNELEFINGFIYANVFYTNMIVKIDPSNGKVVGKLDLTLLSTDAINRNPNCDVLNGIAYDPQSNSMYVTGKFWPNIYQIDFSH